MRFQYGKAIFVECSFVKFLIVQINVFLWRQNERFVDFLWKKDLWNINVDLLLFIGKNIMIDNISRVDIEHDLHTRVNRVILTPNLGMHEISK